MRCAVKECTRESETRWITDTVDDDGVYEQVPVCGRHLGQLASRTPLEFDDSGTPPKRPSVWVLKVRLRNGEERFFGETFWGGDFTAAPGDAHRYESELAARHIGYTMKEHKRIEDFSVEEIVNPRARF